MLTRDEEPAQQQGIADMYRTLASCLALCLTIVLTGCKASSTPDNATTAIGGMMPAGEASPDLMYAVDQAEVKILPERTISTEPLATFREKLEEKRAAAAAAAAAKMATTEPTSNASGEDEATASGESGEKSLWGSVKSLFNKKDKADDGAKATDDSGSSSGDSGWGEDDSGDSKGDDSGNDNEDW